MPKRILLSWVFAALFVPSLSGAVDGVSEINQASVLEAGGFPYQVLAPGSYRLTSNLDLRGLPDAANKTAISVSISDVSIDLNGFSIIGPTVCSGSPPSQPVICAPTGSGRGISAGGEWVTITNGVIRGLGLLGITCGGNCRVERVKVEDCTTVGIQTGDGAILIANNSRGNGGSGLVAGLGAVIRENVVDQNGANGIVTNGSGVIANNTSNRNWIDGIAAGAASSVVSNVSWQNREDGISGSSGTIVRDNSVFINDGYGLNFGGPGAVMGYVNNMISANTLGSVNGGIQLGSNVCGSATTCP